ncbi:Uncharacterized protein FKW44_019467, partial [Caligus rogercresseyi]
MKGFISGNVSSSSMGDEDRVRARFEDIAPQIHASYHQRSRANYLEFSSRSQIQ